MTTSQPHVCDYCHEPALGLTVRVDPDDPQSLRAVVSHPACYDRLLADQLVLLNGANAEQVFR
jgi:hypothetical protein